MPSGAPTIVPARRFCKKYTVFQLPQSAATRRSALRPVLILHAGHEKYSQTTVANFFGSNPFLFKKWVCAARAGQRPPPPSGGVLSSSPVARKPSFRLTGGKLPSAILFWEITSFLPAFDTKSGKKCKGLRTLDPESCRMVQSSLSGVRCGLSLLLLALSRALPSLGTIFFVYPTRLPLVSRKSPAARRWACSAGAAKTHALLSRSHWPHSSAK